MSEPDTTTNSETYRTDLYGMPVTVETTITEVLQGDEYEPTTAVVKLYLRDTLHLHETINPRITRHELRQQFGQQLGDIIDAALTDAI